MAKNEQPESIEIRLEQVARTMARAMADTILIRLTDHLHKIPGTGKMLRSRLVLRLSGVRPVPAAVAVPAAAAVELIHAASLLHDDVIDGGLLRRNAPAFWKTHGTSGAILAGDLMLVKALELLSVTADARLTRGLIRCTAELCNAEAEQELLLRGSPADWPKCVDINRRKTGSLFAFAAGVAAGDDLRLQAALREAGYAIGTAYQLADDLLDVSGDEPTAGKTLGRDRARRKPTAATAFSDNPGDLPCRQNELRQQALDAVRDWPDLQAALQDYLEKDFDPAVPSMLPQPQTDPREEP